MIIVDHTQKYQLILNNDSLSKFFLLNNYSCIDDPACDCANETEIMRWLGHESDLLSEITLRKNLTINFQKKKVSHFLLKNATKRERKKNSEHSVQMQKRRYKLKTTF